MTASSSSVLFLLLSVLQLSSLTAFVVPSSNTADLSTTTSRSKNTELYFNSDFNDFNGAFMRRAREARDSSQEDDVVELRRPLGIVLKENSEGDVFVETIAPKGNAARSGQVKQGDVVTMVSATFGGDMWGTRGVGLTRVLAAIRVRAGPTVKLAFENPSRKNVKREKSSTQMAAVEEARAKSQAKKDNLLKELEKDEKKLTGGKFFGLF
mmetsp:Transcript_17732/g.19771  ORF Transcript_17732/g.19771 Transcript_17732/m.19771 type:complete len:210 (-) Transcript_17732:293-922(-)|eukprot:CAMPEP_0194130788 /NCGR_PEP_ID=MMETSP0152-20130528/1741_1 /TAXON_ID=1049557 /ORGANISM="Thalassiothrix antarctica, Strain L6-D1" /LENGTH=209 /DNA_ID=CAMNT_0038825403 /DNA_START=125 /DNA_END=754 /DNA_ORIENTATION=+